MGEVLVKVKVNDDTQITHDGVTHPSGETFDCETSHAERFVAAGWATFSSGRKLRKQRPSKSSVTADGDEGWHELS